MKNLKFLMVMVSLMIALTATAQTKSVSYHCSFDCPSCEAKIMKNIPYEKGVKNVVVNYDKKLVTVDYNAAKNTGEGIKLALENLGYTVSLPRTSQTIHVNGNCGMCKKTIETAATSIDGVSIATWEMDSKQLTISFDESKTNIDAIHTAIAKSGYDTDKKKAEIEVYNNLPECCKYNRASGEKMDMKN